MIQFRINAFKQLLPKNNQTNKQTSISPTPKNQTIIKQDNYNKIFLIRPSTAKTANQKKNEIIKYNAKIYEKNQGIQDKIASTLANVRKKQFIIKNYCNPFNQKMNRVLKEQIKKTCDQIKEEKKIIEKCYSELTKSPNDQLIDFYCEQDSVLETSQIIKYFDQKQSVPHSQKNKSPFDFNKLKCIKQKNQNILFQTNQVDSQQKTNFFKIKFSNNNNIKLKQNNYHLKKQMQQTFYQQNEEFNNTNNFIDSTKKPNIQQSKQETTQQCVRLQKTFDSDNNQFNQTFYSENNKQERSYNQGGSKLQEKIYQDQLNFQLQQKQKNLINQEKKQNEKIMLQKSLNQKIQENNQSRISGNKLRIILQKSIKIGNNSQYEFNQVNNNQEGMNPTQKDYNNVKDLFPDQKSDFKVINDLIDVVYQQQQISIQQFRQQESRKSFSQVKQNFDFDEDIIILNQNLLEQKYGNQNSDQKSIQLENQQEQLPQLGENNTINLVNLNNIDNQLQDQQRNIVEQNLLNIQKFDQINNDNINEQEININKPQSEDTYCNKQQSVQQYEQDILVESNINIKNKIESDSQKINILNQLNENTKLIQQNKETLDFFIENKQKSNIILNNEVTLDIHNINKTRLDQLNESKKKSDKILLDNNVTSDFKDINKIRLDLSNENKQKSDMFIDNKVSSDFEKIKIVALNQNEKNEKLDIIFDNNVTSNKILENNITSNKILENNVTSDKILENKGTSDKILKIKLRKDKILKNNKKSDTPNANKKKSEIIIVNEEKLGIILKDKEQIMPEIQQRSSIKHENKKISENQQKNSEQSDQQDLKPEILSKQLEESNYLCQNEDKSLLEGIIQAYSSKIENKSIKYDVIHDVSSNKLSINIGHQEKYSSLSLSDDSSNEYIQIKDSKYINSVNINAMLNDSQKQNGRISFKQGKQRRTYIEKLNQENKLANKVKQLTLSKMLKRQKLMNNNLLQSVNDQLSLSLNLYGDQKTNTIDFSLSKKSGSQDSQLIGTQSLFLENQKSQRTALLRGNHLFISSQNLDEYDTPKMKYKVAKYELKQGVIINEQE